MNTEMGQLVHRAKKIIQEEVRLEKDAKYIKNSVYILLEESQGKITDLDHFDKYYFREEVGLRISSYIKLCEMQYASDSYSKTKEHKLRKRDKYKNVSHFMEKYIEEGWDGEMEKYMVTDSFRMNDDFDWATMQEDNEEFFFVEAKSKETAIRKVLIERLKYEPIWLVKEEIFLDFWVSIAYGEADYTDKFVKYDELKKMKEEILENYLSDCNDDPEMRYYNTNTKRLEDQYYSLLTKKELEEVYYYSLRDEMVCIKLTTLTQYRKRESKNSKNIIMDVEERDIKILNVISDLIRQKSKECYQISKEVLLENGFLPNEACDILEQVSKNGLKTNVYLTLENGFICSTLDSYCMICKEAGAECIHIVPTKLFIELANANSFGYNRSQAQKNSGYH